MDAQQKKDFRMLVEQGPARDEILRPQKDVAHVGQPCRAGPGQNILTVRIEVRIVQMRVAVHPAQGQSPAQGVNTLHFFVSHA